MNLLYINNNFPAAKKPLALLMVFIFLANLVFAYALIPTKEAKAFVITMDALLNPLHEIWKAINIALDKITSWASNASALVDLWEKAKTIATEIVRWIVQQLLYKLLAMVTNDIIKWINGGSAEMKFVANWKGYLSGAALAGGQQFVQTMLGRGLMCQSYDQQIRQIFSQPHNFASAINSNVSACSLTNNGWDRWLSLGKPNNNFYGLYYQTLDEYLAQEKKAKEDALYKALSGNGFLPPENCAQWQTENLISGEKEITTTKPDLSSGEITATCLHRNIATPSSVLSNQTNKVVDSGRSLIQQQIAAMTPHLNILGINMTPFLTAIFTSLINRLIQNGLSFLQGVGQNNSPGTGDNYYFNNLNSGQSPLYVPPDPSGSITAAQAEEDASVAPLVARQLKLLRENLETELLPQAQREDSLNGQIRNTQSATLNTLLEISKLIDQGYINCSLPTWAIKTTLGTNGDTTTYKISAGGIGEITYDRTINSLGTTYTIITIEPALAKSTAAENVNNRIEITDQAIAATEDYTTAANDFVAFYNSLSFPLNEADSAALAQQEQALLEKRNETVNLIRDATDSTANSFDEFLNDAQNATINAINEAGQVRDSIIPALETQLGDAQNSYTAAQVNFSQCEPPPSIVACNDGLDNDGDGLIDYPSDSGCSSPTDTDEMF